MSDEMIGAAKFFMQGHCAAKDESENNINEKYEDTLNEIYEYCNTLAERINHLASSIVDLSKRIKNLESLNTGEKNVR